MLTQTLSKPTKATVSPVNFVHIQLIDIDLEELLCPHYDIIFNSGMCTLIHPYIFLVCVNNLMFVEKLENCLSSFSDL